MARAVISRVRRKRQLTPLVINMNDITGVSDEECPWDEIARDVIEEDHELLDALAE